MVEVEVASQMLHRTQSRVFISVLSYAICVTPSLAEIGELLHECEGELVLNLTGAKVS